MNVEKEVHESEEEEEEAEEEHEECSACGHTIFDDELTLGSKSYHPECLVCHQCRNPLSGKPVHIHEGNHYDQECFFLFHAKRCDICYKPITGNNIRFLQAGDKSYHPACYVCTRCRKSLNGQQYHLIGNNRFCVNCVNMRL